MRDPNRIDNVLEVVETIWKANPDLRLTQLILNVCKLGEPHSTTRIYNMEDEALVERLLEFYA